jgi:long-chain acyl-CoA synthetase
VLKHSNICSTVSSVPYIFPLTEADQYLSYLPLAHIFETIAEVAILTVGGSIGFFQDNIKKLTDDLQAVRPSLLCGVPRVFNRIHQVVMAGVAEKSCIVKWYFNKAFNHQTEQIRQGLPVDAKYDAKVFKALRERMGLDNVRVIVTGAAPMPPYLAEFLKVVTAKPVLEGYGMTEASAATSICSMSDRNLAHTGPVVPCMEVRLEDIPDMGYFHTDKNPRGEICVRGPGGQYNATT